MFAIDIPEPLKSEKYERFQKGISDNPDIDVYVNEQGDFAFLYPRPEIDYRHYTPRVTKYGFTNYKKKLNPVGRRLQKIEHLFENLPHSLLEIGAADGSFLETMRQQMPNIHLTAVDQDQHTLDLRAQRSDENYNSLEDVLQYGKHYDYVCLFHVFEHILFPLDLLDKIREIINETSLLVIEVPSLQDPLLSIYNSQAYARFYFNSQHPYVYSNTSLQRLLEYNGFLTQEPINYQRYGLENHLNWLSQARPGGNELFQQLFKDLEADYVAALEQYGKTDTTIWVGKKKR